MGIAFGTAVTVFCNDRVNGYKGTYNQIKLQDIEKIYEVYENTLKDILEKYNNDFTNMVERIRIINDVIAKYQMFTSVSRDMIGKTTYIYTTK